MKDAVVRVFLIHKMYFTASFAIKEEDTVAATKVFREIEPEKGPRGKGWGIFAGSLYHFLK